MIPGVCQGETEYFIKKVLAWLLYRVAPSVQKVLPQTPQAFVLLLMEQGLTENLFVLRA